MTTGFEFKHAEWLERHLSRWQGEALRRLKVGHAHAEQAMLKHIWWPAFGHFRHLHPEYEVTDFLEGRRYLDFAYIRSGIRIAIEVDGYGPHYRSLSRKEFCDQWVRQMHLINDNWIVVRIGYDDVIERPRMWQQLLQQMIGTLFGNDDSQSSSLTVREREIVKLSLRMDRPIKLSDVKALLHCQYRSARSHLQRLQEKGWLIPVGTGKTRTHFCRPNPERKFNWL